MTIRSLKVEDRVYKLSPMPPWEGAELAAEVAEVLMTALAAEADGVMGAATDAVKGGVVDNGKILSMIGRLLPHLPARELTRLARKVMTPADNYTGVACADGPLEQGVFDEWFGKYAGDYFPVAIWAIKENVSGFFVNGGPAWNAVAAVLLPSKSQKTD